MNLNKNNSKDKIIELDINIKILNDKLKKSENDINNYKLKFIKCTNEGFKVKDNNKDKNDFKIDKKLIYNIIIILILILFMIYI